MPEGLRVHCLNSSAVGGRFLEIKLDALAQFATHTSGGLFARPAGVREGEFIGQRLFST